MRKLVFSAPAIAEINAIWDYTFDKWGIAQADEYSRLIEVACDGLASGTQSGASAEHIRAKYRLLHAGKHTIYFRVTETEIEIVRVLHQSMDVGIQFG